MALRLKKKRAAPRKSREDERELHRYAKGLRELGVDPFWLLAHAFGAEARVREWMRLNRIPEHDLHTRVHDALADIETIRSPSVQDALVNLRGMEEDGCEPDALDDVRRVLARRKKPGPSSTLSWRKRDHDDLGTFEDAKSQLRKAAKSKGIADTVIGKHVQEMRNRGLRLERYALLIWAERTGRVSRDWTKLQPELEAIRGRVRSRKRKAEK